MKKMTKIMAAGLFSMLSVTAFACPKGTSLQGGTGPNHKGGKCVAVSGASKAVKKEKTAAMSQKATEKKDMKEMKKTATTKPMTDHKMNTTTPTKS